jgi:hypothetical protein
MLERVLQRASEKAGFVANACIDLEGENPKLFEDRDWQQIKQSCAKASQGIDSVVNESVPDRNSLCECAFAGAHSLSHACGLVAERNASHVGDLKQVQEMLEAGDIEAAKPFVASLIDCCAVTEACSIVIMAHSGATAHASHSAHLSKHFEQ